MCTTNEVCYSTQKRVDAGLSAIGYPNTPDYVTYVEHSGEVVAKRNARSEELGKRNRFDKETVASFFSGCPDSQAVGDGSISTSRIAA